MRDINYERLVVPTSAGEEPVHRWFHMKEAYSPHLFLRLLKDLSLSDVETLRIHDPFLGSGTTLVSAMLTADGPLTTGSGTEINPFLSLLASTKLAILTLAADDRSALRTDFLNAATTILKVTTAPGSKPAPAPALAAFADERFFPGEQLTQLLRMRDRWESLDTSLCKDLIGLALGACIEPCSKLRRDGRALRYQETKTPASVSAEFEKRIKIMAADLSNVAPRGNSQVLLADGLHGDGWPADRCADLVCFSPPYPNNIDYTEVYKLEAWLLNLITDSVGFREQRGLTMRSHPSVKFSERAWPDIPDGLFEKTTALVEPVIDAVPQDRYRHQRERVVRGFAEDCAVALHRSYKALKPGGSAIYAVGNSRHGVGDHQYTIASDVLMAEIATFAGFEVQEVKIARDLHRRGRHDHLRESVVFLCKPEEPVGRDD